MPRGHGKGSYNPSPDIIMRIDASTIVNVVLILIVMTACSGLAVAMPTTTSPFDPHWAHYPCTNVAPRVSIPVAVDGDLSKDVPWSGRANEM